MRHRAAGTISETSVFKNGGRVFSAILTPTTRPSSIAQPKIFTCATRIRVS